MVNLLYTERACRVEPLVRSAANTSIPFKLRTSKDHHSAERLRRPASPPS
jgi:hypothetical protein